MQERQELDEDAEARRLERQEAETRLTYRIPREIDDNYDGDWAGDKLSMEERRHPRVVDMGGKNNAKEDEGDTSDHIEDDQDEELVIEERVDATQDGDCGDTSEDEDNSDETDTELEDGLKEDSDVDETGEGKAQKEGADMSLGSSVWGMFLRSMTLSIWFICQIMQSWITTYPECTAPEARIHVLQNPHRGRETFPFKGCQTRMVCCNMTHGPSCRVSVVTYSPDIVTLPFSQTRSLMQATRNLQCAMPTRIKPRVKLYVTMSASPLTL